MGVSSAVINFNVGDCDILKVFKNSKMETGYFTKMFYMKKIFFANDEKSNSNKWGN